MNMLRFMDFHAAEAGLVVVAVVIYLSSFLHYHLSIVWFDVYAYTCIYASSVPIKLQ